jgi:hypothetical protein
MAKQATKIQRAGAYIVRAAESRPSSVKGKLHGRSNTPTLEDKNLASALLRAKRG